MPGQSQPLLGTLLCFLLITPLWTADKDDWPDDAIAIPGVGEHVVIDLPERADSATFLSPVIVAFTGGVYPAHNYHRGFRQDQSGHVAISILGTDKEDVDGVMNSLSNLLPYISEQAEEWQADPNAIFLDMEADALWHRMDAFTREHPERIRGWIHGCPWFKDAPFPEEPPPQGLLMGASYFPDEMERWGEYFQVAFQNGVLLYDQPVMEEGDKYFLSKMKRENTRTTASWMCYAWFMYHPDAQGREDYLARLLPAIQPPEEGRVDRRGRLDAPNEEARDLLQEMTMWPGIDDAEWHEQIPELHLAMVEADFAWLSNLEANQQDRLLEFYHAHLLMENRDWKRDHRDRYKELRDKVDVLSETDDRKMRAHFKSYEQLAEMVNEYWEQADDQRRIARLGDAFLGMFQRYQKQKGGHRARHIGWRIQSFANGQWVRMLRLPRPQE